MSITGKLELRELTDAQLLEAARRYRDKIKDLQEQLEQKEEEAKLYRLKLLKRDNKILDLETRNEKLERVVGVLKQAILEVDHAQTEGAWWYTKGSSGLYQQVRLWINKSYEALNQLNEEALNQLENKP